MIGDRHNFAGWGEGGPDRLPSVALDPAFPVWVRLPLGARLHPHVLFDVLAYTGGSVTYLLAKRRMGPAGPARADPAVGLWLMVGAVLGAAIGAKALAWLEHPNLYARALLG